MALRAKEADVRAIADLATDVNLVPFMRTANRLTTVVANNDSEGLLDDGMLQEIEQYLVAHFAVSSRDKQYTTKTTGGASGAFQGQYASRLDSTDFGHHAMMLDLTGFLKRLNAERKPTLQIAWLGKTRHEATDYEARQ